MQFDPLSTSTGINQGEAQVFNPIHSDYYRNKSAELLAKKKALDESVSLDKLKTPWRYDVPLLESKKQAIQKFFLENRKDLMKDDFTKKAQLNNMIQDLQDAATVSVDSGKHIDTIYDNAVKSGNFWEKSVKDYENAMKQGSQYFYNNPPKLIKKFDATDFQKDLSTQLNNIPQIQQGGAYIKSEKSKDANGNDITVDLLVDAKGNNPIALEDAARNVYNAYKKDYTQEQLDEAGYTEDKIINQAKNFIKRDLSYSQIAQKSGGFGIYGTEEENLPILNTNQAQVSIGTPIYTDNGVKFDPKYSSSTNVYGVVDFGNKQLGGLSGTNFHISQTDKNKTYSDYKSAKDEILSKSNTFSLKTAFPGDVTTESASGKDETKGMVATPEVVNSIEFRKIKTGEKSVTGLDLSGYDTYAELIKASKSDESAKSALDLLETESNKNRNKYLKGEVIAEVEIKDTKGGDSATGHVAHVPYSEIRSNLKANAQKSKSLQKEFFNRDYLLFKQSYAKDPDLAKKVFGSDYNKYMNILNEYPSEMAQIEELRRNVQGDVVQVNKNTTQVKDDAYYKNLPITSAERIAWEEQQKKNGKK